MRQGLSRLAGPPLIVQLIGLLVGALVAAQLVTLLLTLVLPPAPAREYRLADIAAALAGSALDDGRFDRTVRPGPPDFSARGWFVSTDARAKLAALLHRPPGDVALGFYTQLPVGGTVEPAAPQRLPGDAERVPARRIGAIPPPPLAQSAAGSAAAGGNVEIAFSGGGGARLVRASLIQQMPGGPPGGGFPGGGPPNGGFPGGGLPGGGFPQSLPHPSQRPPGQPQPRAPQPQTQPQTQPPRQRPPLAGAGAAPAPPSSAAQGERGTPAPVGEPTAPGPGAAQPPTSAGPGPQIDHAPPPFAARSPLSLPPPVSLPARTPSRMPASPPSSSGSAKVPPATSTSRRPGGALDDGPANDASSAADGARPARGGEVPGGVARRPSPAPLGRPVPIVRSSSGLFGLTPAPFVEGDFIAAVRLADGRWVLVSPRAEEFPNAWQRRVALWFLLSLLAVAPVAWLFARRIVGPLNDFAHAAETLGRDPGAAVLPLDGPAEIGRAAHAFNQMQSRLRGFVDDRTAMIGAISHDLRTPLTRLRFRIEDVPDAQQEWLRDEVDEMEEMISSVIGFMRDASIPNARERRDLAEIVDDVVEGATLLGDVRAERMESAIVDVDPLGIRRVLDNLLTNAIKYGGGHARVALRVEADRAVADIVDHGPGVPEGELERVFEPFYRSDAARRSGREGSGLGLAVCRSIARAHGGDVALIRAPAGFTARVTLPLAFSDERRVA